MLQPVLAAAPAPHAHALPVQPAPLARLVLPRVHPFSTKILLDLRHPIDRLHKKEFEAQDKAREHILSSPFPAKPHEALCDPECI